MSATYDNSRSDLEFTYAVRNYDTAGAGAFINIIRSSTYNNLFNAVRVIEGTLMTPYAIDVLIGNYLNNTSPATVTCLYESQFISAVLDTPTYVSAANTGSTSNVVKTVYTTYTSGFPRIGPVYSDGLAVANYQGQLSVGYRGNYSYNIPSGLNYALLVSGSVGIGTDNPSNKLTVIGAASIGSTTYNATAPTNGLIVQGNVGVGTSTTPLKLNVSGSIYMAGGHESAITWASDISSQYLKYTSSLDGMVLSSWNNTVFLTQQLERMRISSTGNVSIGTTVTSARLTVASTSQTTKAIIQSVSAATGLGGYLAFNPGGDPTYSKVALGIYDSYYGSFNRGNLAFMLNSAADVTEVGFADTKMYISASGNVGIGTTTPFSKLDIVTNVSSSTVLQAQGTNGILFSVVDDLSDSLMSVNDVSGLPIFEVFADDRIVAGQYGANDFIIANNEVGIGTNNPTTKLHISSSNVISPFYIQTPSATNLLFVSSSGNIGIGTSNPAQRLDVRGYVVSDVNGNGVESGYYLGSSAHGVRRAVATNDVYLYTTTGTLYLGTTGNSSQQLTLLNGGNFGVGVTNPSNKLQVAGNISASALTASAISSSNINITQTLGVGSSVTIGSTLSVTGASTFSGKVGVGSASPVALFDVVTGSLNPAAKFVGLVGVGGAPATTNIGQLYILGPGSGSTTFPFKFDAVAMDTTANSTGKALKGWLKAYITNVSGFVDGTTYYIPVYV